jgi:hypothetical protein
MEKIVRPLFRNYGRLFDYLPGNYLISAYFMPFNRTFLLNLEYLTHISHQGARWSRGDLDSQGIFRGSGITVRISDREKFFVTNPPGADFGRVATPKGWNTWMYFINSKIKRRLVILVRNVGLQQIGKRIYLQ